MGMKKKNYKDGSSPAHIIAGGSFIAFGAVSLLYFFFSLFIPDLFAGIVRCIAAVAVSCCFIGFVSTYFVPDKKDGTETIDLFPYEKTQSDTPNSSPALQQNAPSDIFPKPRISKDEYYLKIAAVVAERSTCLRRQYGCVIVKNDEIIATGYNGAPRGEPNCCDQENCYREAMGIPHGQQYEKCVAVHAEQNAIISAPRAELLGSTAYLAGLEKGVRLNDPEPCLICARMLKNAGITRIVTKL